MATGGFKARLLLGQSYIPIDNGKVTITTTNEEGSTTKETTLTTDSTGLTSVVEIDTPPLSNSQSPTGGNPYSLLDVLIQVSGYRDIFIKGVQVLPNVTAIQQCHLTPASKNSRVDEVINIPPNVQVGDYPPKIPEDPEKPLPPTSGLVVLREAVVPEFIVVHDGSPNSTSGADYTVRFQDYVKNALSSEVFATWPDETLRANAICIVSFALNRVYTEWYRGKGKPYQITNSTAFDLAFAYGRNIYDNVERIVDEVFTTYVKRPSAKQPLLTQFCDGKNVSCPNWLSQWGSKYLGDQGRSYEQILRYYYGDIAITQASKVAGIPKSYPGYTLTVGSRGEPVRVVQEYLNRISQNYPLIKKVAVDGIYGQSTAEAVKTFQKIFGLPATGNVDYATWYKISAIYVAITKIGELRKDVNNDNKGSLNVSDDFIECGEGKFISPVFTTNGVVPVFKYPIG